MAAGVEAGNKGGRIAFDKAWQMRAPGADVSDVGEPVGAEGFFYSEIPVLRVGQRNFGCEREQGHRLCETSVENGLVEVGIAKRLRATHLRRLQIRRRADGRLQGTSLAGVVR